ncbi:hypothetical protein AB0O28_25720 [Microbispora sp. NPDC088329]|uniref:hypothetical protein n=1 Tax=Microbispora sp. NPDC088329 TaxID=3154869 RepID=UPI003423940E
MDDQWMRRVWPPAEEESPPSKEAPTRPYGAPEGSSRSSTPSASPQWPTRPYGGREAGRDSDDEESFTRAYRLPGGDVAEERPARPDSGAGFTTRPYHLPDLGEAGREARRSPERPVSTGGAGDGFTGVYRLPGDGGEETARSQPGGGLTPPYGAPVSERRSADRPVWPSLGLESPEPEEDLPPSGRRYRAPDTPPRRMPRWLQRLLVGGLALVCSAAVIGAVVVTVLHRAETVPPTVIHDQIAGVAYTLPPEWREGVVAPVTGFTSVAARGDSATVMARPGDRVDPPNLRSAVIDLSDLYTQLLLHGDKVEVLDDHAVTVGGRPGHTRAVRAEYTDVVNEPAFMRVTLLTRPDGGSTVLLGLAHPDNPRSRAEIEGLMWGAR